MAKESKGFFGLSNVHIAFIGDDNEYETPIHVPGGVRLTFGTENDTEGFNADNDPNYIITGSTSSASGEMEMASFPDAVIARMLGWEIDKNGALVQVSDGVSNPFAIMYRNEGDAAPRAGVIYKVTATAPEDEYETGSDIKTATVPYTASVVEISGRKMTKATLRKEANEAAFGTFFDSVYKPEFDTVSGTPDTPEVTE